ncbi:MAG: hypothetical protein ACLT55_17670, partial [Phocaeicola vulgatus]
RSSLLYINSKIFVRSEDRDFNYEPIFDCLPDKTPLQELFNMTYFNDVKEQFNTLFPGLFD